jgi:hypothetical protein
METLQRNAMKLRSVLLAGLVLSGLAAVQAAAVADDDPQQPEARRHGLHLPMTSVQADLLRTAIALQDHNSDSAAVIEAIRRPSPSGAVG